MDSPLKSESKLHFTVNDTNNPTSNSFKNAGLYTNVYSHIFLTATEWKQPNECLSAGWLGEQNAVVYLYDGILVSNKNRVLIHADMRTNF